MTEPLLILISLLLPFLLIGLLIWLTLTVKRQGTEILSLKEQLSTLHKLIDDWKSQPSASAPPTQAPVEPKPEDQPLRSAKAAEQTEDPAISEPYEDNSPPAPRPSASPSASPKERPASDGFFKRVNWLTWIGGTALGLGGIFIVQYSVDQGLLGPFARFMLALLLGIGLLGAGEWLRRQPEALADKLDWHHLPLAVSSAGFLILYGSIYAGHSYLDLYSPLTTVVLMAVVALAAIAYALLLGPLFALLGTLGGYCVPLLVASPDASTLGLFLYLFIIATGSLTILHLRPWLWLGPVNLFGTSVWTLLWLLFSTHGANPAFPPVELFLMGLMLLYTYIFAYLNLDSLVSELLPRFQFLQVSPPSQIWMTLSVISLLSLLLADAADHSVSSILPLIALSVYAGGIAFWQDRFRHLPIVTHIASLLLLLSWWSGDFHLMEHTDAYGQQSNQTLWNFLVTASSIAIFYVAFGIVAFVKKGPSLAFSGHIVAGPVLALAIAYFKLYGFTTAKEWAVPALILAGIFAVTCRQLAQSLTHSKTHNHSIGVFAIGSTAGLSLALAFALEDHWLNIAFGLQVAAIAWISTQFPARVFRHLAALLVLWVLIRIELNSELLQVLFAPHLGQWQPLEFLIPLGAFLYACWQFKKEKQDYLVNLLEGATILIWTTFLCLLIRHIFMDETGPQPYGFAEMSVQTAGLLLNATGLLWLYSYQKTTVRRIGFLILGGLGLFQLVAGGLILLNPIFNHHGSVDTWPLINWLSLAYLVPAILLLIAYRPLIKLHRKVGVAALFLAGALSFIYMNMEIRHLFVGNNLSVASRSESEFYAYSVGWLVFAGAMMGVGIWRNWLLMKQAAFVLIFATVAKVFLFDMNELEGILRAVSFLGLGASLIGLGFLYKRYGSTTN